MPKYQDATSSENVRYAIAKVLQGLAVKDNLHEQYARTGT